MKTVFRVLTACLLAGLLAGLFWQHGELLEVRAQLAEARGLVAARPARAGSHGTGNHGPGRGPSGEVGNSGQGDAGNGTAEADGQTQGGGGPGQRGPLMTFRTPQQQGQRQGNPGTGALEPTFRTGEMLEIPDHSVLPLGVVERDGGAGKPAPTQTSGRLPDGSVASWSQLQATGAPDTPQAGDIRTAWAPRLQDAGEEWLQLRYGAETEIAQINIHETYNPGAISKVAALLPDGSEKVIWEGVAPAGDGAVETSIPVPAGTTSRQIKVYLDTSRVAGWNEIDAVEMVGTDGSKQWAAEATASSYYGDQSAAAFPAP